MPLTPGERIGAERIGATASFAVMTVVAGILLGRLLRHLPDADHDSSSRSASMAQPSGSREP